MTPRILFDNHHSFQGNQDSLEAVGNPTQKPRVSVSLTFKRFVSASDLGIVVAIGQQWLKTLLPAKSTSHPSALFVTLVC